MFYRLAGVYRTSYAADRAILKIPVERWQLLFLFLLALAAPYLFSSLYLSGYLLHWLIWSMAVLGLNLLVGWAGQAFGPRVKMVIASRSCPAA